LRQGIHNRRLPGIHRVLPLIQLRAKRRVDGAEIEMGRPALALQHMDQATDFAYQFAAFQQVMQIIQFALAGSEKKVNRSRGVCAHE
jgi:hypothetical protein